MKLNGYLRSIALCSTVIAAAAAGPRPTLFYKHNSEGWRLEWVGQADGKRPYFELQRSYDLNNWQPIGERVQAPEGTATLSAGIELNSDQHAFYRLLQISAPALSALGNGGAEVFGYAAAFDSAVQRIGQISPEQFAQTYAIKQEYLPGLSWDPTTAEFWDAFNANPQKVNEGKQPSDPGYRPSDFRLGPTALAMFKTNGFVVTNRGNESSFADVFYDLWHNDLPVFISCDAILHAWHRTYDAMLEEIEETFLFNSVQRLLDGMTARIPFVAHEVGDGVLKQSLLDADYFLTVARTLLAGTNQPAPESSLGTDALVAKTLDHITSLAFVPQEEFLGFCRDMDYSQFKVRGHYTHSERLARYFQALMWLGRIDFPVAGGPFDRCPYSQPRMAAPRELGDALVLWRLLDASGEFQTWRDMDRTISMFVGVTDSMTFAQMNGLVAGAGIATLSAIQTTADLQKLQSTIASGQLGLQNIRSDNFGWPLGEDATYALPQTFTVFGQKFVPDSWAFSKTVMDSISWVSEGKTNLVKRRIPGALDVAFSVLGNDQVVPELVAQMTHTFADPERPHALQFRDGYNYQHNLAAVRAVVDQQTSDTWQGNIYMQWLNTLRALSTPTIDPGFPEAMRTHAWAMKTVNTQLASWTQLRHDTILYAKQSYTPGGQCVYPKGFVEPRLAFWQRLEQLASLAAAQLNTLNYRGDYPLVDYDIDPESGVKGTDLVTNQVPLITIQNRQVAHLKKFAQTVARLSQLTEKELAQECFSPDDFKFFDTLLEYHSPGGCGGPPVDVGWYPSLFYRAIYWIDDAIFYATYGAGAPDTIIADVHTDIPDVITGDPGSVLHEAIGSPNLLYVAIDNGADRFVCAGPALSHYELEVMGDPRRLSDPEWTATLGRRGIIPDDVPPGGIQGLPPPVWTQSYAVPRE